jgi:hypothetical protein
LKEGHAIAGENEEEVFEALDFPCPELHKREVVERKPFWLLI